MKKFFEGADLGRLSRASHYATEFDAASIEMSDPTYSHSKDEQRGNELEDDWYFYTGISITFRLNNSSVGCDYE